MSAEQGAPPVAAIDCGTNSLRLLLAEAGPDGALVEILRRTEIVRLGQGVDATGAFADEALSRTFAVLDGYATVLADAGVSPDRTRMVATSAARDVSNRDRFLAGVRARVRVEPEVISGDREARLSFVGALSSAAVREQLAPARPVLVVDIGGGSTELVLGDRDGRVAGAGSLTMGSVRLTERFFTAGRPTAADLAAATAYVDGLLDGAGLDLSRVGGAVGVAGTVVTLAWLSGATSSDPQQGADPQQVAGAFLPRDGLDGVLARLSGMTPEEIRAIPGMHPGRADVITAGALIAARITARLPTPGLVVSIADILDGLALEILGSHPA
jgi:exopolyphosphatase / guanosine-5'-triphosphate,3'-diphosphate pyrophosphatase